MKLWTDIEKIKLGTEEAPINFSAKETIQAMLPPACGVQGYTPVEMMLRRTILDNLDKAGDDGELTLTAEQKRFLLERMAITRFTYALENNLKLMEELQK